MERGAARFDPIDDYHGETFAAWAKSALHPSAHLISDGCIVGAKDQPLKGVTYRAAQPS